MKDQTQKKKSDTFYRLILKLYKGQNQEGVLK